MTHVHAESPCCQAHMPYYICQDAYVCMKCMAEYGVLAVEKSHVLFGGMTCISCGSETQPCCGH